MAHARALRRVYDAFQSGHEVDGHVRAVVAQSWERSGQAGINPGKHLAPIVVDEAAIEDRWSHHPLFPVLPVLRDLLSDATTQAGHMLVITDADGVLMWMEGHRHVIEATEDLHLVCGADWSEAGAGTNAMGTAIAVDHPVQIFSAEHFNRMVHPWQCSGAPIHDPETGEILGVVDLTGHLRTAHPHTLGLVTAAAGMAEAFLRQEAQRRHEQLRTVYRARIAGTNQPTALLTAGGRPLMAVPHDWLAGEPLDVPRDGGEVTLRDGSTATAEPIDGGYVLWRRAVGSGPGVVIPRDADAPVGTLRLELLGSRPSAILDGRRIPLSQRHGEILAVLLLSPRGLTAEQLALELYGERGKPVSVRAEVSRLRRLLGKTLSARPYRFTAHVESDLREVAALVRGGRLADAVAAYAEPLLPDSEVPLVVEERSGVDGAIRQAVLRTGNERLVAAWCATGSGHDDLPAAELLLSLLPPDDGGRPAAEARVRRLRERDGGDALPASW
jgi:hypothetical protein